MNNIERNMKKNALKKAKLTFLALSPMLFWSKVWIALFGREEIVVSETCWFPAGMDAKKATEATRRVTARAVSEYVPLYLPEKTEMDFELVSGEDGKYSIISRQEMKRIDAHPSLAKNIKKLIGEK